jgi:biotin carboxyl carrier protein
MNEARASRQLRVQVRGPLELTVQLDPAAAAGSEVTGRQVARPFVRRLGGSVGSSVERFEVVLDGWRFEVSVEPARHAELREQAARVATDHRPITGTLRAQIPGRVTRIWVAAGEPVDAGQRLLAVEAMKMENEVRAPHAGRVETVHVEVGAKVERDDQLVTLG